MSGEDPLADALERVAAELADLKEVVTTPAIPPEPKTPPPGSTAVPNALVFALILMLLGYAFGLPQYMRAYHDDNTPPPEVRIKDAEHDRRLDRLEDQVRAIERGNTP